ncbi:Probable transmembrane protein [Janthinobacterium sp. CG23_2]|nr:Probable transmembrane protein [Janthinobacterium sp. CG23_2]CUU31285.1 Probable transmembrane protein [Janthinobacterium sp. CG23_2]
MTDSNKGNERNTGNECKASFGATMKAVFWSFLGIRKRSDYEKDSASLNPVHVVIAGLIGVMLFIGVLIALVKFAVSGH